MNNQKSLLLTAFGAVLLVACGDPSSAPSSAASSAASSSSLASISEGSITTEATGTTVGLANGQKDFSLSSFAEKGKILGQLEKYAQDEFIAGIPMYDSSGNILYNSRLTIPSDKFIPNYGFGVSEGTIGSPLTATQEPVEAYRSYFHSWQQTEPVTLNYMNDQTSVVSDIASLFTSSYFGTRFNSTKTGYEWYPVLSTTNRPIALDTNAPTVGGQTYSFKWRVKLLTGNTLKYSTLSQVPAIKAFDGRAVELADYLTPFKLMLEENWVRATDLGSETSGFKGVDKFLDGEISFAEIEGIKLNVAENSIDFEFNSIKSSFYAMYSLSSSLYSPIPQAFINALATLPGKDPLLSGADMFGLPTKIVDTILSLGVYEVQEWQPLKQIVFKKNAEFLASETARFSFQGYMYTIIPGGINTAFSEFLAGKLDAATIPATRLQEFKTDPRRRQTLGSTTFKIQVNATTQARWEELFGVTGSVLQTPESDYYDVKPIMSNKDFLNGLYFAINRQDLANFTGRNPAPEFFSDAYMIDPEAGLSWRDSNEGKAAYQNRLPNTQGYSRELSKAYFRRALTALTTGSNPAYTIGTASNPTTITLDIHMQTQASIEQEGTKIKDYIETVFNTLNPGVKLSLNLFATANWYDVYYNSMLTGQFDMAIGAISGNTLDPLNFMDVLASDQRSTFTLSWGPDTNSATQSIQYENNAFSYDALFEASQKETLVLGGKTAKFAENLRATITNDDELVEDGLYDLTVTGNLLDNALITDKTISRVSLVGGPSGTFNWFPGGVDSRTVLPRSGNLGQVTPGDLGDILTTSVAGGVTSFTVSFEDVPKELGPKNVSIGLEIETSVTTEPIKASYTALSPFGEDFFDPELTPNSFLELTSSDLDETNPVKILFNESVGGIVRGNMFNSDLVTTSLDMVGLYSYEEDDFLAVFADLGEIPSGLLVDGYVEIDGIIRINSEDQFVIYIPELELDDEYSFDVFYSVTWSNADGDYTSLNVATLDIPVPENPFEAPVEVAA